MFYLILGETPVKKKVELLDITKYSLVGDIRKAIYQNRVNTTFASINENNISLWKVAIPIDDNENKLKILDDNCILDIEQDLEGKELYPADGIPEDFRKQQPPEIKIIHIIVQPSPPSATTAGTLIKGPAGLVHIFVDNSNLYVQGKKNVARLENLGRVDKEGVLSFDELRIDYGRLLEIILDNRKVGGTPYLVGSRPPSYDSLWKFVERNGFEVKVFDRNCENHEKEVDTEITRAITKTAITNGPGTLVLISGDKDLRPGIKEALENNWTVEIWFWPKGIHSNLSFVQKQKACNSCIQSLISTGIAAEPIKNTSFRFLKDYYKRFSYGYGPDLTNTMQFIDISNGHMFDNYEVINWIYPKQNIGLIKIARRCNFEKSQGDTILGE
ncbi:hypothetical protein C1645_817939 [Glomus cerebriforme]|uniref:Uncharacterized protein n=1 Tax=Glomus cerebriforme TaxID=658196 RepID=A0A397THJ4_9GLOM|nr:hypothetical protein C1645_817939 [Glomus cerebriforme]